MSKLSRHHWFWAGAGALLVVLGLAAYLWFGGSGPAPTSVAFSDFIRDVQANRVAQVTVGAETLEFTRHDGTRFETVAP